jgi:hypothetical protein
MVKELSSGGLLASDFGFSILDFGLLELSPL